MTIERFTKEPGSHVLQGKDDPAMLLLTGPGVDIPDTVTVDPNYLHTESRGQTRRVTGVHIGPCPCPAPVSCPNDRAVHMRLEGRRPSHVAECALCRQFFWYDDPSLDDLDPSPSEVEAQVQEEGLTIHDPDALEEELEQIQQELHSVNRWLWDAEDEGSFDVKEFRERTARQEHLQQREDILIRALQGVTYSSDDGADR